MNEQSTGHPPLKAIRALTVSDCLEIKEKSL
jgi:hypothetical protein